MFNVESKFPYPSFMEFQKQTIESILQIFKKHRFSVLEAPPGSGKSVIAYTISKFFNKTYFLTTQKSLQKQLAEEFKDTALIYSSRNYQCIHNTSLTCGEGYCRFVKNKKQDCIYLKAKQKALNSNFVISNYAYILQERNCSVPGSSKFNHCDLLILDEGHNIESELRNFLTVEINKEKLQKFKTPSELQNFENLKNNQIYCYCEGLHHYYNGWLNLNKLKMDSLSALNDESELTPDDKNFLRLYAEIYTFNRSLFRYVNAPRKLSFLPSWTGKEKDLNLKMIPKDVDEHAHQVLYDIGAKVLVLSGTILDTDQFSKSSGIKLNSHNFVSVPSTFPIQNRYIISKPSGVMSNFKINDILPQISRQIQEILNLHKNEKGIIHAPNYKVTKYLIENDYSKRLISHNSEDRERKLKEFKSSADSKVLISPSMYEGIDLKDELSRFQIIIKIPWLSLDDVITKVKNSEDFNWYTWRTCIKIVQQYGRSVRTKTDYARTYILDSDFNRFVHRNSHMLPKYFKEAIK